MDTRIAVANRLVFLCGQRGWTINKLATVSGVSPSTVKSILYGRSKNPGIVTIKILCDGLDMSLAEFFSGPEFGHLEQEIQ
ncbi:MAG: helix-turn-helix transcriptional regulator [Oscillibacter sp.]|nr:helix-turn-helix transcriptional regulator [Oscillibacter sp.]MCI9512220.1 helix-turn-helix transcriptional regulator [Oscillibacter sp.]